MSVGWDYYKNENIRRVNDMFLPASGEGNNMGTQLVTAMNKLIYKWYNDGDVYDNTGALDGWANDLSSYANWIYRYIPHSRKILDQIFECYNDSDYEDLLRDLADALLDSEDVENLSKKPRVGSIYNCDGPFEFKEYDDEDSEYEEEEIWEDEDEDIESAVDINAVEEPNNEALEELMRNLKDDFDFIMSGLDKLERSSAEDSRVALEIAEKYSACQQETIASISERF